MISSDAAAADDVVVVDTTTPRNAADAIAHKNIKCHEFMVRLRVSFSCIFLSYKHYGYGVVLYRSQQVHAARRSHVCWCNIFSLKIKHFYRVVVGSTVIYVHVKTISTHKKTHTKIRIAEEILKTIKKKLKRY